MLVGELYLMNGWDETRLRQWLPASIVSVILQLQIFSGEKDQIVWEGSSSGNFTVASAFEGLRQTRNVSLVDKLVWSPIIPLKLFFFTWRLLRRWVPLDSLLQS